MTVGELRERATLLTPITVADAQGGQSTTWSSGATVAAAVLPLSGREALSAGAVQASMSTRITIRYRDDVTATMRIRRERDDQVYELTGPPRDVDGRHRWLELDAVEVRQ
jgi:SPP1 family predicted phage head-tail adaptor